MLHIIDASTPLPLDGAVLYWNSWPEDETQSILSYQRIFQQETKDEFLAWLHSFSEAVIEDKALREHFALSDGFSAWWLSLLFDRHPAIYGPGLFEIFKLRALERYCERHNVSALVVHIPDPLLCATLRDWCVATGRSCRPPELPRPDSKPLWKRIVKQSLQFARIWRLVTHARAAFRWLWTVRRHFPRKPALGARKGLAIGVWFPNIDADAAAAGRFRSRYWEDLHTLLRSFSMPVHWLFIHIGRPEEIARNRALRDRFRNSSSNESMTFWEECIGCGELLRVLLDCLRLSRIARRLEKHMPALCRWPGSHLSIEPYVRGLWEESSQGGALFYRVLLREGIRSWAGGIGPQAMGLTASELQFWERSLFHALREQGDPTLYAAMHSSTDPDDMAYFFPENIWSVPGFAQQMPDIFLCNGSLSRGLVKKGGFPAERLRTVEALRYQYLARAQPDFSPAAPEDAACIRLLVAPTYYTAEVEEQIAVLAEAARNGGLPKFSEILIKPHPAFSVDAALLRHFPGGHPFSLVTTPMPELLRPGTVVYAGNSTTVAVEAAYKGLPLVIQENTNDFSKCPLAGYPGVRFVKNSRGLAKALGEAQALPPPGDFFCLDAALPRWTALLREHFPSTAPVENALRL